MASESRSYNPFVEDDLTTIFSMCSNTHTLDEVNKRYVSQMLRRTDFNATKCARLLGIGRSTLYRMLHRWDLIQKE